MSELRWEDPPPSRKGQRSEFAPIAAALRARPGEWAHVATYATQRGASGRTAQIRHGRAAGTRPAGAYEAVTRTVGGEHRVYARYTGGGGDA